MKGRVGGRSVRGAVVDEAQRSEPGEALWQAAQARHQFSDLLARAAAGKPQVVRRRDGTEVVVLSRAAYEQVRPRLGEYLLTHRYADLDDPEERIVEQALQVAQGHAPRSSLPWLRDQDTPASDAEP